MSTEPHFQPIPKPEDFTTPAESEDYKEVDDFIKSIPGVVKETKPGLKTTELWLAVAISALTVLDGIPLPERWEGVVVAALGAAYAISRGIAKQGVPHVEEEVDAEA